jgi:hypothetical protein
MTTTRHTRKRTPAVHRPAHPVPAGRHGERGIALVVALFSLMTLSMMAATGLVAASSNLKATRNYRGATQVHFVAESGLSEALQVINGPGVVHLGNDVVNRWGSLWGTSARGFGPLGGFRYTVTPVATPGDSANSGRLVASAAGPEGTRRVVVANIVRSDVPSTTPGAIYLATDTTTDSTFNGNAFLVDGNDHNYTGGPGPAAPVPGISTRNDTNTQETIASLDDGQKDNVPGLGYSSGPPIVPSVKTSPAAPTTAQIDQIITDLLARPGVVTFNQSNLNGNNTFGTPAAPQITYFSRSDGVTIKGNGSAIGAGILIVESDLTIQGNFEFTGLVIVRGGTNIKKDGLTEAQGNATVYGSLWTNDVNFQIGGSALVAYSSQALALANNVGGGGALPAPVRVVSLADCAQLPMGSGGCP